MKLTSSSSSKKTSGKSRADETRQRRDMTAKQSTARVARNVVVPAHRQQQQRITPGVIVRGMGLGTPVHQKARNKGGRQYYYSLGTTGAEVRLPSMPMVNPGWRILSGLLVLVLLAGIWFAYNNPMFQVSSMEISGIERLTNADILEVVDVSNKPVFTLNPVEIKAQLETAFPQLTDVQVSVGLPASVAISAIERHPAVLWKNGEDIYWIDSAGYVFESGESVDGLVVVESDAPPPILHEVTVLDSPEVDPAATPQEDKAVDSPKKADVLRQTMDPVVLKAALDLSEIIPGGTVLNYSSRNGMGWTDNRGWKVFVGVDLAQIDQKLNVYQAVVNKLSQDGVTPVMISVENLHAPFYRLEQ